MLQGACVQVALHMPPLRFLVLPVAHISIYGVSNACRAAQAALAHLVSISLTRNALSPRARARIKN
jgi:hypothetical protein